MTPKDRGQRVSAHTTREQPDCRERSAKNRWTSLRRVEQEEETLTSLVRRRHEALRAPPRQVAPAVLGCTFPAQLREDFELNGMERGETNLHGRECMYISSSH